MQAQHNFGSYMNMIYFNVYSDTPDSGAQRLMKFVSVPINPPKTSGEWMAYPTQEIPEPVVIAHSFVFHKHPYLKAPIKQGEFKVYTNVYDDEPYKNITTIKNIRVILEFENLEDATRLFDQCRKDLKVIAEEYGYAEEKSRKLCDIYSEEKNLYHIPCGISITLGTEKNTNGLYEVSFQ
jgi:hypothetical protein